MRTTSLSRRSLLRGAAAGAAVAAVGATAAACGSSAGSGSGSGSSNGKATLTVMDGDPTSAEIAAFEQAYPNIKINQLTYDVSKLTAMIAAGSPPDIVRGYGATDTAYVSTFRLAEPLDDYLTHATYLKPAGLDPVNDLWKFDGTKQGAGPRYGITKDYSQDEMFWFNPAVFAAAGVPAPSTTSPLTYDEWTALAKRVTKTSGSQTVVYGMNVGEGHLFVKFAGMVHSLGGSVFGSDLSSVDFSSPEAQQVLAWYADFAKAKCGESLINQGPSTGVTPLLEANRLGMLTYGYWYQGDLTAAAAQGLRLAPAPQMGTARQSPCNSATGAWISAKSKYKDEAFQFLDYWLGGPPAKARAQKGTGIPTLRDYRSLMPQSTPLQKEAYQVQQAELPYFTTLSYTPYSNATTLETLLNTTLTAGLMSGASVATIGSNLSTTMTNVLQQGKQLVG